MLSLALGISMVEAAQRLMAVDADATVIVSAGTAAFALVAAACISIGTFFVVYRIVKRTK
jgi:hypothetical protein